MAYTKEHCLKVIAEIYEKGNLNKLYDKPFIKHWNGKTSDTKEDYQEIFAEFIFNHLFNGKLPMVSVSNVKAYCEVDRQDAIRNNEEGVQRDFYFGRRKLDDKYGKPVWFELQTGSDGQGKGIDLVYNNKDTYELNIFELKYNNSQETLLRAVMEIQTYYQRVDWEKAVKALKKRELIQSDYLAKINKYVLVNEPCRNILKKYNSLSDDSYVKKLIDEFNIGVVVYE